MILRALKEYYDRKINDPSGDLAPFGFEWKEIGYIVVLQRDGTPINLESTYEGKRAKRFLVPHAVKKSVNIAANLLWGDPEYALGINLKGNPEKAKKRHIDFIKRVRDLDVSNEQGLIAVLKFLEIENKEALFSGYQEWDMLKKGSVNVSFRMAGGHSLIVENQVVKDAYLSSCSQASETDVLKKEVCLISGEMEVIERLHPPIKGVVGAQSSGANIVSFNSKASSSYRKDQGNNAPIGKKVAFAYTTALNHLLARDSKNKFSIEEATTIVFWSEKNTHLETAISDIFGSPLKDDPDRGIKAVAGLYNSVHSGVLTGDEGNPKFYVLGLAPNASRISVRFWTVDTVKAMSRKILQHFEDIEIDSDNKFYRSGLSWLLKSIATEGDLKKVPPNLAGDTIRAIFDGSPYPQTLLQAILLRIRAEREVSRARASLLKAYINRQIRFKNSNHTEDLKVSLDKSNTNIGYLLGRLFSVLEKIQQEANPNINTTIRDRYYSAASGVPQSVFSTLMRLKNYHLGKIKKEGRQIYFERTITEIMQEIRDFPAHLSLIDQGKFAVGYYHQVQEFYKKMMSNQKQLSYKQKEI